MSYRYSFNQALTDFNHRQSYRGQAEFMLQNVINRLEKQQIRVTDISEFHFKYCSYLSSFSGCPKYFLYVNYMLKGEKESQLNCIDFIQYDCNFASDGMQLIYWIEKVLSEEYECVDLQSSKKLLQDECGNETFIYYHFKIIL